MKTKKLKTRLGELTLTFGRPDCVHVQLPKETPCEVNRVPLYFSNNYVLKDGEWEPDVYSSFEIPNKYGKTVSPETRKKTHGIIVQALTSFCASQPIFMLGVKLDYLNARIESAHGTIQSRQRDIEEANQEIANHQKLIGELQSEIVMSRAKFKSNKA